MIDEGKWEKVCLTMPIIDHLVASKVVATRKLHFDDDSTRKRFVVFTKVQ